MKSQIRDLQKYLSELNSDLHSNKIETVIQLIRRKWSNQAGNRGARSHRLPEECSNNTVHPAAVIFTDSQLSTFYNQYTALSNNKKMDSNFRNFYTIMRKVPGTYPRALIEI